MWVLNCEERSIFAHGGWTRTIAVVDSEQATSYPRRLFPGFAGGLASGLWVMWSYASGVGAGVSDDTMHELWIRVPTLSSAIGLAVAFVVSEVVGRWRADERNVWFLVVGLAGFMSALSAGATLLGGAYFGSMSIPYVGAARLGPGILVPLFLFSLSLARQQGASWRGAIVSTVLWGGFMPALGALLIAPFVSLSAIRQMQYAIGIVPALVTLGFVVGLGCGLSLAFHVLTCAWWARRTKFER